MRFISTNTPIIPFHNMGFNQNHQSPCLNCTEREIGCHGKCNLYKKFKVKLDEVNKAVRMEKARDSLYRC